MTRSTWRGQRVPTTALLLLALAITTGWTPAAAPTSLDRISPAAAAPAAVGHRLASPPSLPISPNLAAHRAFQATLATSARALFQVRVVGARAAAPTPPPARVKAPTVKTTVVKAPVKKTYSGTNHFWFPALGISRSVHLFACSRTREPDNYLYRWGCAGKNNVYLLGHASTVLRSLHDAYLKGRLKVGMLAIYADANGRVRTYKVTTWRVVNPLNSAWAIASQPVPSMTIQTCVGLNRLLVRLVAVN